MRLVKREPDRGYLDSHLWVPKSLINVEGTKNTLSFKFENEKGERYVFLYEETEHHLIVPRAFWKPGDLEFPVVDCRPLSYPHIDVTSKIVLDLKNPGKTLQRDAVNALLKAEGGVLQLACGKGKTVCALELLALIKQPTVIAVDNNQLLSQWLEEIHKWLVVPGGVEVVRGSKGDWNKSIILTTYKTLGDISDSLPPEIRARFGLFIGDEGHHIAAPTYSRAAGLFFGKRIALTATPERVDGMHVITDFHIGTVLYKDLIQELRPRICFVWTGFQVDPLDRSVASEVCDINGELHLSKLATFFGRWRERLEFLIGEFRKAEAVGRRILVLSNSIEELVGLLALWNKEPELYFEKPKVTPQDVGETLPPVEVDERRIRHLTGKYHELKKLLQSNLNPAKKHQTQLMFDGVSKELKQHEVWKKVSAEETRRFRVYIEGVLSKPSNAGVMMGSMKPDQRQHVLKTKQIVFAITKYGREGLDNPDLDTVFTCEPMSQRNGLQQFMGRVLRNKAGKKSPLVVIFEDDIGPMKGMCENLRRHLRTWPVEEGGPYEFEFVGHPKKGIKKPWLI